MTKLLSFSLITVFFPFSINNKTHFPIVIEGNTVQTVYSPSSKDNCIIDGSKTINTNDIKQSRDVYSFAYVGSSNYPIIAVNNKAKEFAKKTIDDCTITITPTESDSIYLYELQWKDDVPLNAVYNQSFLFVHWVWLTLRFKIIDAVIDGNKIKGRVFTSTPPRHIPIRGKATTCWMEIVNPKINNIQEIEKDHYIYDGKQIHYRFPHNKNKRQLCFSVSDINTILIIRNCKNLVFRGFHFRNNGINDITFGSGYQAEVETRPCILIENSDSITFEDCDFTGIIGYCIKATGGERHLTDITIRNCHVHDTFGGGFHFTGCHNSTIENNTINNYGHIQSGSVALLLRQNIQNCRILNNTICYGPYTGISIGWTWGFNSTTLKSHTYNNTIAYNHIHHCMMGKSDDGGGIYTLGESKGTVIENNCIHHIYARKENTSSAVYFDEGSTNIKFCSNVCYDCDRFVHLHYGYGIEIKNNLFKNSTSTAFRLSNTKKIPNHEQAFLVQNNIISIDNCVFIDDPTRGNYLFTDNLLRSVDCKLPPLTTDLTHYRNFHRGFPMTFDKYFILGENGIRKRKNNPLPSEIVDGFRIHTKRTNFSKITILDNPDLCGSNKLY